MKRTNHSTLRVGKKNEDTISVLKQSLEIIGRKVPWNKTDIALTILKGSKICYYEEIPHPKPSLYDGFGGSEEIETEVFMYGNLPLIRIYSMSAPSAPGDGDSYMYYTLNASDSLACLSAPPVVNGDEIKVKRNVYYTLLTQGCVTVRIPITIDVASNSVEVVKKDSAIFKVEEFHILIHNEPPMEVAYNSPRFESHLYSRPDTNAPFIEEPVYTLNDVTLLKEYYPNFGNGDTRNVWTFIKLGKKYGWIFGEERISLGVDDCG